MKKERIISALLGIIIFIVLVVADRLSKYLAVLILKGNSPFVLVKNVFQLFYLENHGAAFGILQGRRFSLILVTVIVLAVIFYAYIKAPRTRRLIPLRAVMILIASGAFGNCIDRAAHGYVIDFFYFILIDFPIFNVADIYVTFAAVLLVILILFYYKDGDLSDFVRSLRFRAARGSGKT